MSYSRGKVQILYNHLPGALFAHDEYGHCKVTGIELNELTDVNHSALADVVRDAIGQWREQWQHAAFPTVRNEADLARYFIIGEARFTLSRTTANSRSAWSMFGFPVRW